MKKAEIIRENTEVWNAYGVFKSNYYYPHGYIGRLRSCNARVYEDDNYIVLESYDTIVAFIDKKAKIFYDVLRYVYGYTATSAQHIAKFRHDYAGKCETFKRYYDV